MKIEPLLFSNPKGKLGGFVASRNPFGSYLREYVVPIQPNTPAQIGAKTAFGIASSTWQGLTVAEKQLFNTFAKTSFQPRRNSNRGQYSGQHAFNALFTQFQNALRVNRIFTVAREGVLLPGGITTAPFSGPILSSLLPLMTPTFTDGSGNAQVGSIIDATLDNVGGFSFTMQMGNGSGFDFGSFQASGSGTSGFAVYASSANAIEGQYFRNPEKYLLGYCNPPTFVVPSEGDDSEDFTIQTTDILNIADYQNFPAGNSFVQLSVYVVNEPCQMKLIGRFETQVISGP